MTAAIKYSRAVTAAIKYSRAVRRDSSGLRRCHGARTVFERSNTAAAVPAQGAARGVGGGGGLFWTWPRRVAAYRRGQRLTAGGGGESDVRGGGPGVWSTAAGGGDGRTVLHGSSPGLRGARVACARFGGDGSSIPCADPRRRVPLICWLKFGGVGLVRSARVVGSTNWNSKPSKRCFFTKGNCRVGHEHRIRNANVPAVVFAFISQIDSHHQNGQS